MIATSCLAFNFFLNFFFFNCCIKLIPTLMLHLPVPEEQWERKGVNRCYVCSFFFSFFGRLGPGRGFSSLHPTRQGSLLFHSTRSRASLPVRRVAGRPAVERIPLNLAPRRTRWPRRPRRHRVAGKTLACYPSPPTGRPRPAEALEGQRPAIGRLLTAAVSAGPAGVGEKGHSVAGGPRLLPDVVAKRPKGHQVILPMAPAPPAHEVKGTGTGRSGRPPQRPLPRDGQSLARLPRCAEERSSASGRERGRGWV